MSKLNSHMLSSSSSLLLLLLKIIIILEITISIINLDDNNWSLPSSSSLLSLPGVHCFSSIERQHGGSSRRVNVLVPPDFRGMSDPTFTVRRATHHYNHHHYRGENDEIQNKENSSLDRRSMMRNMIAMTGGITSGGRTLMALAATKEDDYKISTIKGMLSSTMDISSSSSSSITLSDNRNSNNKSKDKYNKYMNRLEENILTLPSPSYASEFNGIDNTYFPSFLEGTWNVTQTLTDTIAPLGLQFLGGPNGDISIAEKTIEQSKSKIGQSITLQLRYVPMSNNKSLIAEDRTFNTKSRLNAFAGKSVVASVQYADVGGSNRQSVLAMGGSEEDPLQTTMVYFKGPAAQKNFLISHGGASSSNNINTDTSDTSSSSSSSPTLWAGYEVQRSIFALTNQSTSPPITTDTEYIWQFEKINDNHVVGKLRIVGYLNAQTDRLYFDARNRGVSLQDYTLDMIRS